LEQVAKTYHFPVMSSIDFILCTKLFKKMYRCKINNVHESRDGKKGKRLDSVGKKCTIMKIYDHINFASFLAAIALATQKS